MLQDMPKVGNIESGTLYQLNNLSVAEGSNAKICDIDNNSIGYLNGEAGGYYSTWKLINKTLTKINGNATSAIAEVVGNELKFKNQASGTMVYNGCVYVGTNVQQVTV